jgi:hypothetical protein
MLISGLKENIRKFFSPDLGFFGKALFLKCSFRPEIIINLGHFDTHLDLRILRSKKKFCSLKGLLYFLARKYDIRITKAENNKTLIYNFGLRIPLSIQKCINKLQFKNHRTLMSQMRVILLTHWRHHPERTHAAFIF